MLGALAVHPALHCEMRRQAAAREASGTEERHGKRKTKASGEGGAGGVEVGPKIKKRKVATELKSKEPKLMQ